MGGNCCTHPKIIEKEESIDLERVKELKQKIRVNPKLVRLLKRLQTNLRTMVIRKKLGIAKQTKTSSEVIIRKNFTDIPITKNIDQELLEINNKYKPLKDKVNNLEGRKYIKYEDNSVYYGEWLTGFDYKHGRGVLIFPNGTRYEGYFLNDKVNIYGNLRFPNNESYEGEFFNGKYSGYGTYIFQSGEKYTGSFKENRKNGQGKEIYPDGSIYTGDFVAGLKHGYGKIIYTNKDEFEGQFHKDQIHGKGIFQWYEDKTQFIAEWKENKISGDGVFVWASGKNFAGNYKEDLLQGLSSFVWDFGVKYRCKWDKGLPSGEGGEFYNPETHYWQKIQDEKSITNPPREITPTNNSSSLNKIHLSNNQIYKKNKTNQTDLSNTSTSDFKIQK